MGNSTNLNEFVNRLDRLSGLTGEDKALQIWKKLRLAQAISRACDDEKSGIALLAFGNSHEQTLDVGQIRIGLGIDTSDYSDLEILQAISHFSLREYVASLDGDGYSLTELEMGVFYWQNQAAASRTPSSKEA